MSINMDKLLELSKKITILYVEDDEILRNETNKIFKVLFKEVILSSNGEEGIYQFKKNKIDLIITDICMPKMDGISMIEKIRKINNDIPIIIYSAYTNTEYFLNSINIGIEEYLIKPLNLDKFKKSIFKILEKNELHKKNSLLNDYQNALNNSSIVSKLDLNGDFIYVNNKFCKISGYSKDELLGNSFKILHYNTKKNTKKILNKLNIDFKYWEGKIKIRTKSNELYWTKTTINPIFDENKKIKEYLLIYTNITEEQKIKEFMKNELNKTKFNLKDALRMSYQYEMAINESNILSKTDLNGVITFINDKFCEISGYSKDELIGQNHNIIRHPDMSKYTFENLWKTIRNGKTWQGILKNRRKNGSPYWVSTTIIPIKDKTNNIKEYIAIRHDLTKVFDLHKEIADTQRELVYKMSEVAETRSKETGNHIKRVAQYSKDLALLYGLSDKDAQILFDASPMHDIGKIGIPDNILKKPGKLTNEEFEIMKTHAEIGFKILNGSNRPVLNAAAIVAKEHHERWDGLGYPHKMKGNDIHIYGRITALADVFDALSSKRCYKDPWKDKEILKLIKNERGKQFDPKLVDVFLDNIDIFLETRSKFKD